MAKKNYSNEFYSSLKLQKFLFFYEVMSKVEHDSFDLSFLRGYINGPVFSAVYRDYIYRNQEFVETADQAFNKHPQLVNTLRAEFASFLVRILNETDLSLITHELNIWNAREKDIQMGKIKNISLTPEDLNAHDVQLLTDLRNVYSPEYIHSVIVISIGGKNFVINQDDLPKLTDDTQDVFLSLANEDSLQNPVYVSVSHEGVLLVD